MFTDLSFELQAGRLVQIEGANGAGKTSLLRILAGLSRYGFDGVVERHQPMLYLGHQPAVKGLLTPRENLAWHVAGESEYSAAAIDEALAKVGLYGYENVPAHNLSAGQQRRVSLARLYLSDSPLWLLDEPFTAIDVTGVGELEQVLLAKVKAGGCVVFTSHQAPQGDHPVSRLCLREGLQEGLRH